MRPATPSATSVVPRRNGRPKESLTITAGAGLFEVRKLLAGEGGVDVAIAPLVVGMVAALLSGLVAIRFMLSYLRRQSLDIFVWYRFALAAVVLIAWLAR